MRSWKKTVTALLVAILLVVVSFLIWTNVNFNTQLTRRTQEMAENALNLWVSTTEMRLDTVHEHMNEVLMSIYKSNSVKPGSPSLSFEQRQECQTTLEEKLSISSDADCFFVLDTESDWFLFSARTRIRFAKIPPIKEFVRERAADFLTGFNDSTWSVVDINDETFFIKTVQAGKYTAGAMCGAENFDLAATLDILRDDGSCIISAGEELFYAGGKYDWSEELRFSETGQPEFSGGRLAFFAELFVVGGKVIVGYHTPAFWENFGWSTALTLFLCSLLVLLLILVLVMVITHRVLRPMNSLLAAQEEIGKGNLQYRISDNPGSQEFQVIYRSFNNMAEQIRDLRIESYDRLLEIQDYRLKMVRAQIKPHFYLNAITTVSNMTYQNRQEDIRVFLQALAKYMRYMMNIQSSWVSIQEELTHVKNYIQMQKLRFPGSVELQIHCSEETGQVRIPFLMLFTLVENAIKHAMSLYNPLRLTITCGPWEEEGFSGVRIQVEDNGDGFPPDVLEEYKKSVSGDSLPPKEHLGLSNVSYTMRFTYQRTDLLRLSNSETGARAELLIPRSEGEDED